MDADGKRLDNYTRLDGTQALWAKAAEYLGRPRDELVIKVPGHGTWLHPFLLLDLGRWASPHFAVVCWDIVLRFATGRLSEGESARAAAGAADALAGATAPAPGPPAVTTKPMSWQEAKAASMASGVDAQLARTWEMVEAAAAQAMRTERQAVAFGYLEEMKERDVEAAKLCAAKAGAVADLSQQRARVLNEALPGDAGGRDRSRSPPPGRAVPAQGNG